jgi:hypothetical protein
MAGAILGEVRDLVAQESSADDCSTPLLEVLQRLCHAAVRDLSMTGCWVRLMTEPEPSDVGVVSDPTSQALEELQFTLGEGPCIDAFASREPVLDANLSAADEGRWPIYAPAALAHGARAIFAFPLQVGAARVGVLGMYADHPGGFTATTMSRALAFAEVATEAVLDGQAVAAQGTAAPGLDEAMDHRAELYQAQGMVMVQLSSSLADAMVIVRGHAYSHQRSLGAVAHDVVTGRLRLARH